MALSADLPKPVTLGAISGGVRRVAASPSRGLEIGAVLLPVVGNGQGYGAAGKVADILEPLDLPPGPPYDFRIPLASWQGGRSLLLLFIHKGAPGGGDDNFPLRVDLEAHALHVLDEAAAARKTEAEAAWLRIVASVEELLQRKPGKLWHGVMGPPPGP